MLTQGSQTFTWNERDQLTATSSGSGTFAYDALGRRIAKTVAGVSRSYLYDGGDIAQELAGTQVAANTITGGGIDDVLWRREEPLSGGSAVSRSFLTDALGSTVGLTDGANTLSTSYTYEPYGKTTATDTNPFRFTGREDDGANGLQFNRARYYSPGLSRFISQDPIGLAGGPNVYGYAGMAPTVFTDPLGLLYIPGLSEMLSLFSMGDSKRWMELQTAAAGFTPPDTGTACAILNVFSSLLWLATLATIFLPFTSPITLAVGALSLISSIASYKVCATR